MSVLDTIRKSDSSSYLFIQVFQLPSSLVIKRSVYFQFAEFAFQWVKKQTFVWFVNVISRPWEHTWD